ncbi:MAG: glutathione S-transferase N-terminal domain-containing protein [Fluviibacter sp.]
MKLLGTPTSPYVRKVRLVLLEKNIAHDYLIDPPREPGSLVVRVNPLGRIPALILDDETCVFDSPVIAEYVDSLNDNPILIPRDDALARMRVKRWEGHHGFCDYRAQRATPPGRQTGTGQYHPAQQGH